MEGRTIGGLMAKHRAVSNGRGQDVRRNLLTLEIQTKVWLEQSGQFVLGEGGLTLLREIERRHSLVQAARAVGWSYRHAWGYLRNAERQCGASLVKISPGEGIESRHSAQPPGTCDLPPAGRCPPRGRSRRDAPLAGVVPFRLDQTLPSC